MTISVAKGLRAALAFLERAAGLELKDRLVSKQLFVNFYEEQLTRSMPGRILGQAPRPLLVLLGSLEFFVRGSSGSPFCRAFAWWKLVQAWGVMRHSDHEGFTPHDGDKFMVDSGSITATLTKTKTTGIGKKVATRPIYVSSSSWVLHADWLTVGWSVLSAILPSDCDFLLPTPVGNSQKVKDIELSYASAQRASQRLFSLLEDPFKRGIFDGNKLLHPLVASSYWREHSGRTFLPSAASVLGLESKEIDSLGGWRPRSGQLYVRTVHHKLGKIQQTIRDGVSAGTHDFIDEKDSLISLGRWLRSKGIPSETVDKQLQLLTFPTSSSPASSSSAPAPHVHSVSVA